MARPPLGYPRSGGPDARAFINTLATQPQIGSYLLESVLGQLSAEARELIYLVATFRRPVDLLDVGLADIIQHRLSIEALPTAIDELQRHHLVLHPDQPACTRRRATGSAPSWPSTDACVNVYTARRPPGSSITIATRSKQATTRCRLAIGACRRSVRRSG